MGSVGVVEDYIGVLGVKFCLCPSAVAVAVGFLDLVRDIVDKNSH